MSSIRVIVRYIAVMVSLAALGVGGVAAGAVPASAAGDYSSVVLASSPWAYWRVSEQPPSTTAADDTGLGHDGTYASCVQLGQPGPIRNDPDTAGLFGNPGCWMTYQPSTSYAGPYSVEAWVRPGSATKPHQTIFDTRSADGEFSFDLSLEGSDFLGVQQLHIDVGDGHEWLSNAFVPLAFTAGQWYYIVATVSPAQHVADLYVNGSFLGESGLSNFGLPTLLFDQSHPVAIGGNPRYDLIPGNALPGNFDGTIGQVAVYEQVLTPATIATHYVAGGYLLPAKLTLGGSSSVSIGKPVTITGTLAYGVGSVPAGTTLTVTRTAPGTASKVITVATAAGGTFTLTDTPTAAGTYAYTASYAGNSTTAPATASRQVSVVRLPSTLTVTTGAATFTYEPTVNVTAHLGTTYRNRVVSIYAQALGSSTRTLLKTGQVDSRGNLAVSYRAPHSTTFTAVFTGDARYAPATVARTVGVLARVTQAISGYYATTTAGGTVYHLFHGTGTIRDLATVAPNKHGQCVKVEVQEFYQGAWHANVSTGCIALSSASQVLVSFGLRQADHGVPYRQRADYIRSSSDVSNLSNDSSWSYALVET